MSGEQSEGLESFVAIVEHGSIAAAARSLEMPRETLSRRLSRLEDRLKVRLVHRSTRELLPTPEGKALYVHARRMVDATEEAIRAVRRVDDVPRGTLRLSVPPGGGAGFAGAMFLAFMEQYPEVELEIIATSRFVDLRAEGIDVALRAALSLDESLIARRLWRSDMLAVAAPAYAEARGLPRNLDELGDHTCLLGLMDGHRIARWPTRTGDTVRVDGNVATNDLGLRRTLALAGKGITLLPRPFASRMLETGELLEVLPDTLGSDTSMAVVFVERERMQPKVRAFIDHTVSWFAEGRELRALVTGPR